jgi:hypothetical protein
LQAVSGVSASAVLYCGLRRTITMLQPVQRRGVRAESGRRRVAGWSFRADLLRCGM